MFSGRKAFSGFKSLAQLNEKNINSSEETQVPGFFVFVTSNTSPTFSPKYLLPAKTLLIHFLKTLIWIIITDQR